MKVTESPYLSEWRDKIKPAPSYHYTWKKKKSKLNKTVNGIIKDLGWTQYKPTYMMCVLCIITPMSLKVSKVTQDTVQDKAQFSLWKQWYEYPLQGSDFMTCWLKRWNSKEELHT